MAFAHWMLSLHSSVQPAGYVRGLLLPVLLHLLLLLLLHLLFFVCLACFCLLHALFKLSTVVPAVSGVMLCFVDRAYTALNFM